MTAASQSSMCTHTCKSVKVLSHRSQLKVDKVKFGSVDLCLQFAKKKKRDKSKREAKRLCDKECKRTSSCTRAYYIFTGCGLGEKAQVALPEVATTGLILTVLTSTTLCTGTLLAASCYTQLLLLLHSEG